MSVILCPLHRHPPPKTVVAVPKPVSLGGIIHSDTDDTLAFTPDGNTVFFDRGEGRHKTIVVSHKVNGHWSQPHAASFSGRWFDQNPVISSDGSYLLFDSDRPVKPGSKPLVQNYFAGGMGPGSNIWKVEYKSGTWAAPVWLGPVINNDSFVDFPSIASDGTLYFLCWDQKAKVMHTWKSRYQDGKYLPPVRAGLGDPAISTHDPAVAPDQSFIVFDYGKMKGGLGRLCIAFKDGDHWGEPIDLGDAVNKDLPWGSHIAPDGHTIYYTGQSGIWCLSLKPWLRLQASTTSGVPKLFPAEAEWASASDWGTSADESPTFTPDGKAVYFAHEDGERRTIMVSHLRNGAWTTHTLSAC